MRSSFRESFSDLPYCHIHGVALAGSQDPATSLTGRPTSARMTFFDQGLGTQYKR